ncbi:uncharacterized protein EV420DRAFT_691123 [Desarmillaria tabescens]|nr:uncharacterized protein EV420DRAFT_691123 [Desarmillaria tabescens]KAK0452080.1 hypothetical protein EV420DRAFT_691123 [Desarmillaria tabescens]
MFWVAFCKLALLPVIGILLTQGLTHRGVIFKDALVERFVAMLLSGTPSSVNQLIVTQLYAKDHDLDTLSVFLLFQYIFMFVSTATITAVTLSLL